MSLSRAWSSLSRKSSISSVVSLDADAAIIARNGMKRALLMELSKIAQEAKVDGARALVHLDGIFPGAIREVNELVRAYSQKDTKYQEYEPEIKVMKKKEFFDMALTAVIGSKSAQQQMEKTTAELQALKNSNRMSAQANWLRDKEQWTLNRPMRKTASQELLEDDEQGGGGRRRYRSRRRTRRYSRKTKRSRKSRRKSRH